MNEAMKEQAKASLLKLTGKIPSTAEEITQAQDNLRRFIEQSHPVPDGCQLVPGLDADEKTALARFQQTIEDEGSYDTPREMIARLAEKGAIRHLSAGRYMLTDAGRAMLAAAPKPDGGRS